LCSGIIQDSIIGPLLFVVYINDIVDLFTNDSNQCTCKLYADDVTLYSVIKTGIECSKLQDGLNKLYEWSDKWQLRVSLKKCNVIFVGNCDIQAQLYLGDYPLATSTTARDLGILVDSDFKFGRHINHIVARAHARANLIYIDVVCQKMLIR